MRIRRLVGSVGATGRGVTGDRSTPSTSAPVVGEIQVEEGEAVGQEEGGASGCGRPVRRRLRASQAVGVRVAAGGWRFRRRGEVGWGEAVEEGRGSRGGEGDRFSVEKVTRHVGRAPR